MIAPEQRSEIHDEISCSESNSITVMLLHSRFDRFDSQKAKGILPFAIVADANGFHANDFAHLPDRVLMVLDMVVVYSSFLKGINP
jgi:hypothetical protein